MKTINCPFLKLPKDSFTNISFSKIFTDNLKLPCREFPPRFQIEKDNFFCGGYFTCYNEKIDFEAIARACQNSNWQYLGNLIGNFIIIYANFTAREIFVLTDQAGTFPCFFSLTNNHFTLSSSFTAVKEALSSATLNINTALDLIAYNVILTDETILSEIHQIPPATLLKITPNFSYSLAPLINREKYLTQDYRQYADTKEFGGDFILLLRQITAERLRALNKLQFAADISSGFDSSLICYLIKTLTKQPFTCYSGISQYTPEDTDPSVVKEFATKHGLNLKFINEGYYYPFATENDRLWTSKFPHVSPLGLIYDYHQKVAKDGNCVIFTGDGGDEICKTFSPYDILFSIQMVYFQTVRRLKLHLDRVVTKKAIDLILDRGRFQQRKVYFSTLSQSVTLVNSILNSFCWDTGVWLISPFSDPRLFQFARGIPHQGLKAPKKQEIWQYRKDIFLEGQFRPKGGSTNQNKLLLIKNPAFAISILERSILAQIGLIDSPEIIQNIKAGVIQQYFEGDAMSFLRNVLKLDYFLQNNNIKIPYI